MGLGSVAHVPFSPSSETAAELQGELSAPSPTCCAPAGSSFLRKLPSEGSCSPKQHAGIGGIGAGTCGIGAGIVGLVVQQPCPSSHLCSGMCPREDVAHNYVLLKTLG